MYRSLAAFLANILSRIAVDSRAKKLIVRKRIGLEKKDNDSSMQILIDFQLCHESQHTLYIFLSVIVR